MKFEVYEITPTEHKLVATDLTQKQAEAMVKRTRMTLMVPKEEEQE